MEEIENQSSVIREKLLAVGYWLLAVGGWRLAVGF